MKNLTQKNIKIIRDKITKDKSDDVALFYKSFRSEIAKNLLRTENCVNFSRNHEFEVKPGKYSPVYVNLKATLANVRLRNLIVNEMVSLLPNVSHICGIESGGSYYAAALADRLGKEFLLFRSKCKGYGMKNSIVGSVPTNEDSVVLIDDVLATGTTISRSAREFKENGLKVTIMTVFSYGFDEQIARKYSIDVISLIKFDDLVNVARNLSCISSEEEKVIYNYLLKFLDLI
jgi:orotate phosphoribosyltransferase